MTVPPRPRYTIYTYPLQKKIQDERMPMNEDQMTPKQAIYQIKIKGFLDNKWSDWFDGFSITHNGETETILII